MEINLPLHSQMSCMCTGGGASMGKKEYTHKRDRRSFCEKKKNTQKNPQEMH